MQSEVNQEENLNTTDFDEHFAKISSYIVDTLHGVPLEMTEDEKEQFRIQAVSYTHLDVYKRQEEAKAKKHKETGSS